MDYKPSPHSLERSLLQKAVRRGYPDIVEKVFNYLISQKDIIWMRKRLYIITYEECWPYGNNLIPRESKFKIIEHYKKLAISEKNKNAAGLAGLANLYTNENRIINQLDQMTATAIRTIANSIKNTDEYWDWIKHQSNYRKHKFMIEKVREASIKASFSEEEAMFYSSAYFCIKDQVPVVSELPAKQDEFPYWVAIDKHTTEGKDILAEIAEKYKILPYHLYQIAFFMEGSVCNKVINSPYWELFSEIELRRRGYRIKEAQDIWDQVKQDVIDLSAKHVDEMLNRINNVEEEDTDQINMF